MILLFLCNILTYTYLVIHREGLLGVRRHPGTRLPANEKRCFKMSKTDQGHFENVSGNVENVDLRTEQYFSYQRTTHIYHRGSTARSTLSGREEIQFSVQGSWPGGPA